MLKLCADEVSIPLKLFFDKSLQCGKFPTLWKKANVQPVHKKGSRQLLLPICSKIFEKIMFDQMYTFLVTNNLLSENQSGFRPGDSTINQLLSITTSIYDSFENYEETRALFLDISKAFDKVWHEGLLFGPPTESAGSYKFSPVCLSVRLSVRNAVFSESVHYFFLKLWHKLGFQKCKKVTEPDFRAKLHIWAFWGVPRPNLTFLIIIQNFDISFG